MDGHGGQENQHYDRQPDPRGRGIGVVETPYWNKEIKAEHYDGECDQTDYRENKDAPSAGFIEVAEEKRVRLAAVLRSHD
ncbi:hypothetical protein NicSoilB8_20900 [Arthrobacter sp. NicSoilB8]|nr:hypothetical protein NicSoilB8_20900 [Arthrobacter sp. NicSoilB8]